MCPPCPRTCVHHVSGPYKGPKRNQKVLAPSYGLRCAQVPSLRLCSVGTPPRAIHGPSRLSRHPCRSTHSSEPPLGLPGGQADQKHYAEAADRPACLVHIYCAIPCRHCRRNKAAIFNANIGYVLNASVIKTLSSRPQPPAQHIQQITPITQQLRRNSSHMLKIYRVSLLHFPTGKRFHQLGDGQYASSGVGVKYVKGRVTVDQ